MSASCNRPHCYSVTLHPACKLNKTNSPLIRRSCFEEVDGSPPTHLPSCLRLTSPFSKRLANNASPKHFLPHLLDLPVVFQPSFFQTCFQLSLGQSSFFQSFLLLFPGLPAWFLLPDGRVGPQNQWLRASGWLGAASGWLGAASGWLGPASG